MRFLVALLASLAASSASAEGRFAINWAGGVEGGTITHAARPDGVLEVGGIVELIVKGNLGVGVTSTNVRRLTDAGPYEEVRFDATVRYVRADRKVRFGAGLGFRKLFHETGGDTVDGYDFIYLDGAFRIAGTTHVGVDLFYAWAFGCYSDTITQPAQGDMLPPKQQVRCTETISTTYTVGVATSFTWR